MSKFNIKSFVNSGRVPSGRPSVATINLTLKDNKKCFTEKCKRTRRDASKFCQHCSDVYYGRAKPDPEPINTKPYEDSIKSSGGGDTDRKQPKPDASTGKRGEASNSPTVRQQEGGSTVQTVYREKNNKSKDQKTAKGGVGRVRQKV